MDKEIKKLFLESFHIKNDAKLIPFSGYNMPINYKNGIIKEHLATRSDCGIFDVSHMLQINIIANEQTTKKLENIIPLDLYNLKIGKSAYSFILNDNGGIIDDLIISKIINNKDQILYYIVLNASRRFVDLKVLSETLGTTNLINTRNNYSLIAVQGPRSRELLSNIFPEIMKLSFMEIKNLIYDNFEILISCSGYTGEDGFELSIPNNIVTQLVKKILSSNEAFLCGLGSRDTLRLEAGLCLYGNELNENINPKEASLLWTIPKLRKNKMNFKG
ncbi:MAG: Aminomethyltransferase, partial [Alphaproteobacteria bacterium MarineAlpha5_Bin11]